MWQAVVRRDEEDGRPFCRHPSGRLSEGRVVADDDAEGQAVDAEHRGVGTCRVHRSPDGRMMLAVHSSNHSSMPYGGRVVQPAIVGELLEAHYGCDGVTRQRRKHRTDSASRNCEASRIVAVVGEATEDRLRAAQDCDVLRFALLDASSYLGQRVQRARVQQRRLIRSNPHATESTALV
jgi:hypothetical protein